MSVVELATMRAVDGQADAMEAALPRALAVVAAADGSLDTLVLRCIERPREFVLRIEWVSVEAHQEFRTGPHFAVYRKHFAEHLDEVLGFAHYNEI